MSTEAMLRELERAIKATDDAVGYPIKTQVDRARDLCTLFLRDHGPALADAAKDWDRLVFLVDQFRMVDLYRVIPTWGGNFDDLREAIDAARGKEVRDVGG